MSDRNPPGPATAPVIVFADALTDVVVAHGVARLSLAMTGPNGKPQAVATLCVPVMQLPVIASGLGNLLQQMQAKAKDAQLQGRPPVAADTLAAAADAAFRFNT